MRPQGDMPAVIVAAGTDVGQASYVQWLESMFIELRGQGVQWTPDDVERACHWRALGVPLSTTRRVLGARIATWRAMNGSSPAPFSLRYYEPAVLAAMGGHGNVGLARGAADGPDAVGLRTSRSTAFAAASATASKTPRASDDATETDAAENDAADGHAPDLAALQLIAHLITHGTSIAQASSDPAVADATRRGVAAMRKAIQTGDADVTLLDAIGQARDVMHKRLLRGIGPSARDALQAKASERTGTALDAEAAARRQRLWTEALLSEELGVLWPTLDGWCARVLRHEVRVGA